MPAQIPSAHQSLSLQISEAIAQLRHLTQVDMQQQWQIYPADLPVAAGVSSQGWKGWATASLNARDHIAWSRGERVMWLGQRLVVPERVHDYPVHGLRLRMALTWWAIQADVFVNGQLVQTGDLFDCSTRILLSDAVQPGDRFDVAVRLVSPGHDDGALVRSQVLYERPSSGLEPVPEPGFVADELAVLNHYLMTFDPGKLDLLRDALTVLQWSALPDREAFDQSLVHLRQQLLPLSDGIKQRTIKLLGHAHLDLAWLWPVSETWEAAERTFESVLQLQDDFPELVFCHSTPALYAWVEQNRPDLFARICDRIQSGQWEVVAGLWIEPELNLISGESIVRQVLYGQRYVQDKFGDLNKIAWLPDSFGFCWQLPQILTQGGVEYFVTQKLRWNDTTEFPHELFEWRSPDGSPILGFTSPPIGTDINPVKMAEYACMWESRTGLQTCLWLPGVGDHGGGPTRDMLEVARRWQQSPFFPHLDFSTALDFLKGLHLASEHSAPPSPDIAPADIARPGSQAEALPPPPRPLPVWNDELYLEFHRGCYTSHADQKLWNRECETLLYQAELYASLATLMADQPYPQADLECSWKKVLFNQFHDILPGSSIPEVYAEINPDWEAAQQTARLIRDESLAAIAHQIHRPLPPHPDAVPIWVFNPLTWARSEVIEIDYPSPSTGHPAWQVCCADGTPVPSQLCKTSPMPTASERPDSLTLLIQAEVPGLGYRLFWLCPAGLDSGAIAASAASLTPETPLILENDSLKVTVNPQTGELSSLFDKRHSREVLREAGNSLQIFQDQGQYWDAWNIDPNYAQHPLSLANDVRVEALEQGPVRQRIRVTRTIAQSTICQDYLLEIGSSVLKIVTEAHWQERHVVVKAAFPVNIDADYATYDMPFGTIRRTTRPSCPAESAKWEVPALHWADLSSEATDGSEYGVSLMSDCKYGYDSQPSQLRLTLLRGSVWPDPEADQGFHSFSYAIYPHAGDWKQAQTVRHGYNLAQPLIVLSGRAIADDITPAASSRRLSSSGQFLNITAPNLIMTAFKPSEDDPEQWIWRCYEAHGEAVQLDVQNLWSGTVLEAWTIPERVQSVNILELPAQLEGCVLRNTEMTVQPCAIASLKFKLRPVSEKTQCKNEKKFQESDL